MADTDDSSALLVCMALGNVCNVIYMCLGRIRCDDYFERGLHIGVP